ncbi:ribosomal-protein-S5p-alanine acetyltransferase [Lachnospiraceae bacterium KM106-2]|nr:ribosomal-protein-S5p-alanine acetyltransferase [Lachnospiraceae bacterium KM106-2]
METLETKRLQLREWELSDANDLYSYAKTSKVGPMAGWKPHESLEESKQIIEMFQQEDETWAICLKENHKVIGSIGLHHTENPKERMLGYVLGEDLWGRGIVPEASRAVMRYGFERLALDSISVYHFPFNQQSKRVIQKLGFQYITIKEKSFQRYDGVILDEVMYRIKKDEFQTE